jgi:hypothetical protein
MVLMSTIDPNQPGITPSPQDLLDEALANSTFGNASSETTESQNAAESQEPPQEQALDTYNDLTHVAQSRFNKELTEGVPSELRDAQQMTSTLNDSIVANGKEALAAAAQTLKPDAVLSLLQV